MFGIGGFELFIILIFGFLIFGPDKLPEIAKTVGKGIARFRQAQQEVNDSLGGTKIFDPSNTDEPFKNPIDVLDKVAQQQGGGSKAASSSKAQAAQGSSDSKAASAPAPRDSGPAGAAASAADVGGTDEAPRQESFTERKARYERERAARKAAEAAGAADSFGKGPEGADGRTDSSGEPSKAGE